MAALPLPQPISIAPFAPDPNEKTFTQILNETLGNLGTSADGFDAAFNPVVTLRPPGGGLDTVMGPAAAKISDVRTAIANGPIKDFLPSLQGAIKSGHSKFNRFAVSVGPSGSVPGTVTPPTPTPPIQQPAPCTPDPNNPPTVLADMTVGDAPRVIYIDQEVYGGANNPLDIRGKILCGDPDIFMAQTMRAVASVGGDGTKYLATLNLIIHAMKAGTFTGAYEETEISTGNLTDTWVTVTIKPGAKGTGGIPIVPQQ